jgi:hypothetical protein
MYQEANCAGSRRRKLYYGIGDVKIVVREGDVTNYDPSCQYGRIFKDKV